MSVKPADNPAVLVVAQISERKGLCIGCKRRCNMAKTFRGKAGPLDRKQDGTMYTEQEVTSAVADLCSRWSKGPPVHHLCATAITDKLAGFDINTGTYGLPPADLSVFYGGSISENETTEDFDFSMGDLDVDGMALEGAH